MIQNSNLKPENRAFLYGDAVFETVKIVDGKILFLEDHYFRLMAAMRILRMEIPMNFDMEYFKEQILLVVHSKQLSGSARARITVYRNASGNYLPSTNEIAFVVEAVALKNKYYLIENSNYEVDLYKDFYVSKQLLSCLKTTNRILNIIASIYASENGLDNCFLLNESKNVVEATQGNVFMIIDNRLITPPVSDGCLNGIMRKQVLEIAKKHTQLEVVEASISPFDIQKADEIFITNVIKGIQPVSKYRKKEFQINYSNIILQRLNEIVSSN